MIVDRHAYRTELMLKPTSRVNQPVEEGAHLLTLRDVFESQESTLLRYAFSLTGRRAVAEEIVQDVFLLLHTRWDQVDDPPAWLVRCVRNKAFDYIRNHKREPLSISANTSPANIDEQESPEDMLLRMEAMGRLRDALLELSDTDRQLVTLKYFEDLRYSDISAQTGLSISNVGYRLHHILKQLAEKLRNRGIDEQS